MMHPMVKRCSNFEVRSHSDRTCNCTDFDSVFRWSQSQDGTGSMRIRDSLFSDTEILDSKLQ